MHKNADVILANSKEFDLVDEMMWEDLTEFLTLEQAGLENGKEFDTVTSAQKLYYNDEGQK